MYYTGICHIINGCGLSNVGHGQFLYIVNQKWVITAVKQRLRDQFIKIGRLKSVIHQRELHTEFLNQILDMKKKYLDVLPLKFRKIIAKFRTSNHDLPIELGRWDGTPINERTCPLCKTNRIADEFRYL